MKRDFSESRKSHHNKNSNSGSKKLYSEFRQRDLSRDRSRDESKTSSKASHSSQKSSRSNRSGPVVFGGNSIIKKS